MPHVRRHNRDVKPSKFKTTICQFFANGEGCPFGEKCAFAHGDTEIRDEVENVPVSTKTSQYRSSVFHSSSGRGHHAGGARNSLSTTRSCLSHNNSRVEGQAPLKASFKGEQQHQNNSSFLPITLMGSNVESFSSLGLSSCSSVDAESYDFAALSQQPYVAGRKNSHNGKVTSLSFPRRVMGTSITSTKAAPSMMRPVTVEWTQYSHSPYTVNSRRIVKEGTYSILVPSTAE